MKFDLISVIFRLHGLLTVFRNFLRNVKTLEPKTYITILSTHRLSLDEISRGPFFRPCATFFHSHSVPIESRFQFFFQSFFLSFFFFLLLRATQLTNLQSQTKIVEKLTANTVFFPSRAFLFPPNDVYCDSVTKTCTKRVRKDTKVSQQFWLRL